MGIRDYLEKYSGRFMCGAFAVMWAAMIGSKIYSHYCTDKVEDHRDKESSIMKVIKD